MKEGNIFENWEQLATQIQSTWEKLTDQDLEMVKGNMDKLVGLIQEKHGDAKETIKDKIKEMVDRL